MLAPYIVILIVLVCFAAVLLLLKLVAKARWLTAIPASVLIGLIIPMIFGIRMFDAGGPVAHARGGLLLVPGAVCILILAVQFFAWLFTTEAVRTNVNKAERDRILKMVECGKISTDEGADLLDAMGRSSALRGQDKFSRLDLAILVGVALVILGFFLPWDQGAWTHIGRIYQAGHQRGPIGWAILIAAVLSAVPIFITPKDLLYKISMLQIFLILVGLALIGRELMVGADEEGAILCLVGLCIALLCSAVKVKHLAV
ncbi:MAG: hypothetical protein JW720_10385 [Sedimentisphaerales bacterium]|nr:hypothetical protein [Sedimentisphaerales bacterium]